MLNTIELSQKYRAIKILLQVLFSDAGGGQGLGLVSGGGRLHGSLGYSGLFLLVVSLALIGPTYKIEASHWLREAKGACFVLPHLLRTVFFSLNQLVQFVFESSGVMAVAHLAWPSLDFLSEDVFWFRTGGLPGNKNSVLSLDLILWRLTQIWRLWSQWETPGDCSRVPQLTCIWMSLPGASGLGYLTRWLERCSAPSLDHIDVQVCLSTEDGFFCQRKYTFFIIKLWSMFISFPLWNIFLIMFQY